MYNQKTNVKAYTKSVDIFAFKSPLCISDFDLNQAFASFLLDREKRLTKAESTANKNVIQVTIA